jgi:hypothetical protein
MPNECPLTVWVGDMAQGIEHLSQQHEALGLKTPLFVLIHIKQVGTFLQIFKVYVSITLLSH